MCASTRACIADSTVFARVDPDGFTVINSVGYVGHDLKYIFELSGRRGPLLILRCSRTIRPVNTRVSGYRGLMDLSVVIGSKRRQTMTTRRRAVRILRYPNETAYPTRSDPFLLLGVLTPAGCRRSAHRRSIRIARKPGFRTVNPSIRHRAISAHS